MRKLLLTIALVLFFGAGVSYAEKYNFGNTDLNPLLGHIFDGTSGHNHDGTNSARIRAVTALSESGTGVEVVMTSAAENLFTLTPTKDSNLYPTGGTAGDIAFLRIKTSGTGNFALTFTSKNGYNFKPSGTLNVGSTTGKAFVIEFINDGVDWLEVRRSSAL